MIYIEILFLNIFFHRGQALSLSPEETDSKCDLNEGIELTKEEFASELRMTSDAAFVSKVSSLNFIPIKLPIFNKIISLTKMFELVDKDKNGSISFREFLDLMVIFHHGSAEQKLEFIFNIYDTRRHGCMTIPEFTVMIRYPIS